MLLFGIQLMFSKSIVFYFRDLKKLKKIVRIALKNKEGAFNAE